MPACSARPQLALAKDLKWPLQGFAVENAEYSDMGLGEWTGFYDWLRDSDGGLLGVATAQFRHGVFSEPYASPAIRESCVKPHRSLFFGAAGIGPETFLRPGVSV